MSDKAIACPFCEGTFIKASHHDRGGVAMRCEGWKDEGQNQDGCFAFGPNCDTEAAALSAWNTRVPAQSAGGGVSDGAMHAMPHAQKLAEAIPVTLSARAVLTDTAREGEYERGWKECKEACAKVAEGVPYLPPGWPDDGVVRYRKCPTWTTDGNWSVPPQWHTYGKGREDSAIAIRALPDPVSPTNGMEGE